jgi:hypothetical protein
MCTKWNIVSALHVSCACSSLTQIYFVVEKADGFCTHVFTRKLHLCRAEKIANSMRLVTLNRWSLAD